MNKNNIFLYSMKTLLVISLAGFLGSCGGGSSDGNDPVADPDPAPVGNTTPPTTNVIVITAFTPLTATIGENTTFSITGNNFPNTLAISIQDATSCTAPYSMSSNNAQIDCVLGGVSGNKDVIIRDQTGGGFLQGSVNPNGSYVYQIVTTATAVVTTPALNDTGITFGGNYPSGNNASCIGETIAEQDCSQGRDAQATAGSLTKVGTGQAGFDFTKIASNGDTLAATATSWSCVRDNNTGLVWEVKTTDGGIHDAAKTYAWGGKTALITGTYGTQYMHWNTLVDGSNSGSGLCGFVDWRVPARDKLHSIVNYSQTNPSIDSTFFPNTVSNSYWSASPYIDFGNSAWGVVFYTGHDDYFKRFVLNSVRLVRGGQ